MTMKSYHIAMQKQEQLVTIFNNPNSRVAAGEKGKEVLDQMKDQKKEKKVTKK